MLENSKNAISREEKKRYINRHQSSLDIMGFYDAFCVRQALTNSIRPKSPFSITWNLTNRCNLQCRYCSNVSDYNAYTELSKEEKLRLVDKLAELGVRRIFLLGGEPTLVDEFNELLDKILGNNIFLSFSTNGSGINSETIDMLKKYSVNMYKMNVSCDSIIEGNNALSRGANSYTKAINALRLLNTIEGIHLTFFSVITEYTKRDIIPTYEFLKRQKISSYGITVALKKGRATDADIINADDIVDDIYTIMIDSENSHVTDVFASLGYSSSEDCNSMIMNSRLSEQEQNIYFREKCNCCITRLHIECNGDVYPCDNLKFPLFNMGNILREQFSTIWSSEQALYIAGIRRKDKEECKTCPIENCTTGCMGLAYEAYQSICRKDPNCRLYRYRGENEYEKNA